MRDKLSRTAAFGFTAFAAILAGGLAVAATSHDYPPSLILAQATPPSPPGQLQIGPQESPTARDRTAMRRDGPRHHRKMRMRRHAMKLAFAIADADGDGALSFEEVMDIHKRIFGAIDADKDGKVTQEEVRMFIQD
nr:MAG: hypothetical protein DIU57_07695 [Pseudomonadota bacterium]